MKKIVSLALVLCLILSLGISASAADVRSESAEITYRDIRLLLEGREIIPCDENGNTVEAFILEGSTYLPLRAVAQALGLGVKWISETSTVELSRGGEVKTGSGLRGGSEGSKTAELNYRGITVTLDGKALELKNANGEAVEPFILDGTTYLPLRVIGEALGLEVDWDGATSTVLLGELPEEGTWEEVFSSKTTTNNGEVDSTVTRSSYDSNGNLIRQYVEYSDGGYIDRSFIYEGSLLVKIIDKERRSHFEDTVITYEHSATGETLSETLCIYPTDGTEYDNYEGLAMSLYTRVEYNEDQLVSSIYIGTAEGWEQYDNEYTASGMISREIYTSSSGESYTIDYSYNDYDAPLLTVYEGSDGKWTEEYTYNEMGSDLSYVRIDGENSYTTYHSYDENGYKLTSSYRDTIVDSETGEKTVSGYDLSFEYNSDGWLLSERNVDLEGSGHEYRYTYDSFGNILTETFSDTDGNSYETLNSYDEEGRLIATDFSSNDGYWEKTEIGYNEAGFQSSVKATGSYGYRNETFSFDKFGNPVSRVYEEEYDGAFYSYVAEYEYEFIKG